MLNAIALDRGQCLQQQLVDQLQELIRDGRLQAGTRMPSSRMLADQFAISRNTVVLAYDRLIAEGLLETRPAQGTFVVAQSSQPTRLSVVGGHEADAATAIPLKVWRADPALFPLVRWRVLMRSALDSLGSGVGRQHPAGEPALRKAVAAWLSASRAIAVSPEQIILTESRQHAVHIATHLALQPGSRVVLEDPCEELTTAAYADAGAEIVRAPVDSEGLRVDLLPDGRADLAHVTPEHQRLLGAPLSLARRHALLAWAKRAGAMVLEDDSPGELQYGSRHASPLILLDQDERVMLIGSFATSLGPWLRMAYLVVPRRLSLAATSICQVVGGSPSRMEQIAMAELLQGGCYARHVHKVGKIYAGRRDALVTALHRHFGGGQTVWGAHAGLHLTWFPKSDIGRAGAIAQSARHCGLEAMALPTGHAGQAVMLGFGTLSEAQIDQRVERLATMLPKYIEMAMSAD
jgi:GntR family transcriptional regulator / MocR family aminotransferase